jgi:hypothetical protein
LSNTASCSLCLNVGCGLSFGQRWINIDSSYSLRLSRIPIIGKLMTRISSFPTWPASVVCGDIVKGLRIPHCSCQLIFASHVLEHLSEQDFYRALENLYSYLCPGGFLRCIVPDLETYAREYIQRLSNSDAKVSTEANTYFLTNANMGVQTRRNHFMGRAREALSNSRHQWMWDRPSLEKALGQTGFRNVRFRKYGEWVDDRFREVEDRGRHLDSICAEAQKPLQKQG